MKRHTLHRADNDADLYGKKSLYTAVIWERKAYFRRKIDFPKKLEIHEKGLIVQQSKCSSENEIYKDEEIGQHEFLITAESMFTIPVLNSFPNSVRDVNDFAVPYCLTGNTHYLISLTC